MKISANLPFQIIYSVFKHQYLGYLFESFIIQTDENGKLSLKNQNISIKNANEFSKNLDDQDFELIKLIDSILPDVVIKKYLKSKIETSSDFFERVYGSEKGDKTLQKVIEDDLDNKKAKILYLLKRKRLFEMGSNGEPAWRPIEILDKPSTVLFHFRRNKETTHYFPTIKNDDQKIDFQYKGSYIICKQPAWMVSCGKLYYFKNNVDGNKLLPFLNKKFIVIKKNVEEIYFKKFVCPLIQSFDVYAKGFQIRSIKPKPQPILIIKQQDDILNSKNIQAVESQGLSIQLVFQYEDFRFSAIQPNPVTVEFEKKNDEYIFHRVSRDIRFEQQIIKILKNDRIDFNHANQFLSKSFVFGWLEEHHDLLSSNNIFVEQSDVSDKKYFLGHYHLDIEIKENEDWFDIYAVIKFGDYEISIAKLRQLILSEKTEFILPNGEVAIIPQSWISRYSELFAFALEGNEKNVKLKKHHLSLVKGLEENQLIALTVGEKLNQLMSFRGIESVELPNNFNGQLREYQQAGYEWFHFLHKYSFGGCLADDMGLGKTVQTLAFLQSIKENNSSKATLLVMPTSLVFNWEIEAKKFTPQLKILIYTSSNRIKSIEYFAKFDVVITSYGIVRIDLDVLKQYMFDYVILDESQVIKNPNSLISKSVNKLNSNNRLILTGTPLENSTMDLWSQMDFINKGLLGTKAYFTKEFLHSIEKKSDEQKSKKLHQIIKPFILRRQKSQVATDLPQKIETIQFCSMTSEQEELYQNTKSKYRNLILDNIKNNGTNKAQFLLLQGLTKLRQISNHPKLVDEDYQGSSGKLNDLGYMINSSIVEKHKILIFSQFVKHLSIVRNYLDEENIQYTYLDGGVKNRQDQVNKFQEDEQIKVFLISLKAGGLGLNLTKADYVFILDPWWNPAIERQAIDRAHRIGQQNKVFTYKFITKNTVEEKILALQHRKDALANQLITTESGFFKNLTNDDIEQLLT